MKGLTAAGALVAAAWIAGASATEIRGGTLFGFQEPGAVVSITTQPPLPRRGQSFDIQISGIWNSPCIPDADSATLGFGGADIYIGATPILEEDCDSAEGAQRTPFSFSVRFRARDWNHVPEDSEALTLVYRHRRTPQLESWWQRTLDLRYGLHTIPPRLGSGLWVSEDLPSQGLLIQQQGDVAVFYTLDYNRLNGEPNWEYADARFDGNTANGASFQTRWLAPSEEPGVQPAPEDLQQDMASAAIAVDGFNRLRAYTGVDNAGIGAYHPYRRWVFSAGESQLPVVVPDLSGEWWVYSFDGLSLIDAVRINLEAGRRVGKDRYAFHSTDGDWVANCHVQLSGAGECTLGNISSGLTLTFSLDDFNGNVAEGLLTMEAAPDEALTGIFLDAAFALPE